MRRDYAVCARRACVGTQALQPHRVAVERNDAPACATFAVPVRQAVILGGLECLGLGEKRGEVCCLVARRGAAIDDCPARARRESARREAARQALLHERAERHARVLVQVCARWQAQHLGHQRHGLNCWFGGVPIGLQLAGDASCRLRERLTRPRSLQIIDACVARQVLGYGRQRIANVRVAGFAHGSTHLAPQDVRDDCECALGWWR
mmetsp:Transcript_3769/g.15230  ORF Transcript_3769/g.15230 Transcript_3769/m.15230 type:complete len:208 (-) Transcript_3769:279-902(-)